MAPGGSECASCACDHTTFTHRRELLLTTGSKVSSVQVPHKWILTDVCLLTHCSSIGKPTKREGWEGGVGDFLLPKIVFR